MASEVLRLSRVTYRENDTAYLRDFDLDIRRGEVMGLLPLNLYGIPALMNVIENNPPLYYGSVYYMGEMVNSWRDMTRRPNPITVIDSASSLVAGQSVLTNIYMMSPHSKYIVSEKVFEQELRGYLDEIGVDISPRTRAEKLTVFERVVVELMRGLIWGHKLIVLREISSYIGELQLEQLYGIMDLFRERGVSFLYISGHYEELQAICDRTALMSNGRIIMKLDREMTEDLLADICINEYPNYSVFRKEGTDHGNMQPVLEIEGLEGAYLGRTDLDVYEGEYLVLHAPDTRIYNELVQILFGDKRGKIGAVRLDGKRTKLLGTRDIAFIRANADKTMIFNEMSYMDNLLITSDHIVKSVWRNRKIRKTITEEFSDILGEDQYSKSVDSLSKKERRDLLYARIMLQHPRVVFAEMPFNEMDAEAKLHVREIHREFNERGIAMVIITVNLNESVMDADRVIRIG